MDITETDVIVVGAGIAGLVAARTAAERGARVLVLDAHAPGGRARTATQHGYQLNIGPHALYESGHLHRFLTTRGVDPAGGSPGTKTIGVLRGGRIHRVTLSAVGIARLPVLRPASRARFAAMFARLGRLDPAELAGRSVAAWLDDVPGDVAQLAGMLVRVSTYTDAPDLLDAGAAVAQLQLAQRGVRYLDGGWAQMVAALRGLAEAAGATVLDHAQVTAVSGDAEVTVDGRSVHAGTVILAAGGPEQVEQLTGRAVDRGSLTAPVLASVLDLGLRRIHDGVVFGMDEPLYLSPHAPAAQLAPPGHGLVALAHYVRPGAEPAAPAVEQGRLRELARLAGITDDDVELERPLHRLVVAHGAPGAAGGGLAGRPRVDALGTPDVLIAGDWVGAHGMLADASAASGEHAGTLAAARCGSIRA